MKKKYQAVTIRFTRRFFLPSIMACAVAFALADKSSAADYYFDANGATAGSGNVAGAWNTGTNWSTDAAGSTATTAWADGNSAIFSAGTDGVGAWTATVTGTIATPSILIQEAGAKTIAGGTITIGGGAINSVAAGNANALTISSVLAGTGGLSINANGDVSDTGGGAAGMLVLSGTNTISGDISINSGVVRSNSSFGNASNKLILNGGGIMDANLNTNITNNIEVPAGKNGIYRAWGSVATGQLSGAITGSGTLVRTDGGTVTLNSNFSGFTGTFRNAQGTTVIGAAAATTMAAVSVVQSDGPNVLRLGAAGDTTILSLISDRDLVIPFGSRLNIATGTYTTVGAGATYNGFWAQGATAGTASATGEITSSGGTLTITNGAATGNLTTTDNQVRLKVVNFNGSTPLAVVKNNRNSLVFDMPNTYTGGTTINGGRLQAGNLTSYGTGTVTVNVDGQAYPTATGTYANNFVINGSGTTEAAGQLGAIRFQNNTISGSINVASAARMVAYGATGTHTGTLTGSANLDLNLAASPGTINFTGNTAGYTGLMTLNAGNLNVGATGLGGGLTVSGGAATVAGPLGGALTVNAGAATVAGGISANVAVNAGRANLNGAVTGAVTVADGGKVAGEGAISGALNLGSVGGADLHVNASTAGTLSADTVNLAGTNFVYLDVLPSTSGPFTLLSYTTLGAGDENNFQVQPAGAYRGNPTVVHDVTNKKFTLELNAGTRTWNNAAVTGIWDAVDANWVEGDNKFFNGDSVAFTDLAAGTVTMGTALQPLAISLTNTAGNNYIFTGGSIVGTTGISMTGGGNLTLGGANTFTGAIEVAAGVLTYGATTAPGASSGVNVAAGARVNLNGLAVGGAGTTPIPYTIAGDGGDGAGGLGAITNTGADVFGNSGIRNLTLSANAEIGGNNGRFDIGLHGGTSTSGAINGGGFTLTKVGSNAMVFRAPASNISYVLNAGALTFEDFDTASGTNPIVVNNGTVGSYNNRTLPNDVNFTAAGNTLVSQAGTGTWTGALTLAGATNFTTTGNLVIDGSLAGSGDITRTGANTLVLQNTSASYTGKINNTSGTLRIESASATGTYAGADAITMGAGTTLQGGTITALASATVGTATTGITQAAGMNYDAGAGNTLTIAGPVTGLVAGVLEKPNNTGNVVFSNSVTLPGSINGNGGSVTFNANLTLGDATGSSYRAGGGLVNNFNSPTLSFTGGMQFWQGTTNIAIGTGTTSYLRLQEGSNNPHTVNHTAGALTVTGDIRLGHWGGSVANVYNISAGSLNQPDTVTAPTNEVQANLFIGIDGFGALNISGTGVVNTSSLVVNGRGGTTSDTLNLTGGRLNIGKWGIRNPGTAIVNLGGGVLGASADWTSSTPMILTGTGGNVTVNTLDSVNGTSARSITLTGALSGAGGLTKTGEGNLVLSGGGTFAGTATSTGGSLFLGTTAWTNGIVASSAGGIIQPGTLAASGTSTVAALNFNGGSPTFRAKFTGGDQFAVTGVNSFAVSSPTVITVIPGSDLFVNDVIPLINYEGTIGGASGFAGLSATAAGNPHFALSLENDVENTVVNVKIDSLDSLIWKGNVDGSWDVNTTSNWETVSDSLTSKFYDVDAVKFTDDGSANTTITLTGAIKPSSVEFDASIAYTLQGAPITGSSGLIKKNSGALTLLNDNTYTGLTSITGGSVVAGNGATSGLLGGTGTITLETATLTFDRSDAQTLSRTMTGPGSTFIKEGSNTLTMSAGNNTCDIVINDGTVAARGGAWATSFAAGRSITVNAPGILDTVTHSLGGLGGATFPSSITLNEDGIWKLNNEQYLPANTNLTAGIINGPGEIRGGGIINVAAHATKSSTINAPINHVGGINYAVADGAIAADLLVTGAIYGGGALTKNGVGTMVITGANTYTGATNINAGTLQVGNAGTSGSLGTGNVVNNGSLVVDRTDALTVANVISGTGSFTQDGAGTTTLGGTNTYSGDTIVKEGVLAIDGDSLLDDGSLVIEGGKVDVTNNETVTELFFGAVAQAAGTYGATGSGATNIDDTRFQGTGIVTVTGAGYGSWITGFGLSVPNQSASADPDNDGIANGVEWVLGGNPATGMDVGKLPVVVTDATNMVFSFKRDQESKVAGTTVVIEVGTSLDAWTTVYTVGNDTAASTAGVTVTDNLDGTDTITLTVPKGTDAKKFARLKVIVD
jgi:autotransporter-associated beta strand protein